MAGGRGGEDAVLADEELLDAIGGANLGDELDHLWVPVAAVAADDEKGAWGGAGQKARVSGLVCLHQAMRTIDAFGDGEEDAGDKGLAVVRLLEDGDLFAETGTGRPRQSAAGGTWERMPSKSYVPGFWS